jgi:hypothetical protein
MFGSSEGSTTRIGDQGSAEGGFEGAGLAVAVTPGGEIWGTSLPRKLYWRDNRENLRRGYHADTDRRHC